MRYPWFLVLVCMPWVNVLGGDDSELRVRSEQLAQQARELEVAIQEGRAARCELDELLQEIAINTLELQHEELAAVAESPERALKMASLQVEIAQAHLQRYASQAARLRSKVALGLATRDEQAQAESEHQVAELAVALAELEQRDVQGQITPNERNATFARLIQQKARLELDQVRARQATIQQRIASGQSAALELVDAEFSVIDAEGAVAHAEVEAQLSLGELRDEQAAASRARIEVSLNQRRAALKERVVALLERAHAAGLVAAEQVNGARDALAAQREELSQAQAELGKHSR